MGLENNTGKLTYVNIKKGKLATKSADGTIYEHDSLSGVITGIEFKDDEYNGIKFRKICLTITDGDDRFLMQVRTDSGYYRALSFIIPNADLSKRLKIQFTYKEVEGRPQTGAFIYQHGETLKWYYKKDDLKDLPPLEKFFNKRTKKDEYDNTAQIEFLEKMWMGYKYKLTHHAIAETEEEPAQRPLSRNSLHNGQPVDDIVDDLPF